MKIIRFIVEGRFGMGIVHSMDELVLEYEDGMIVNEVVELVEDWKEVERSGGIICGSGDDGVEYVIGGDEREYDELWEVFRKYDVDTYKSVNFLDEWYEKMLESEGKLVDLY